MDPSSPATNPPRSVPRVYHLSSPPDAIPPRVPLQSIKSNTPATPQPTVPSPLKPLKNVSLTPTPKSPNSTQTDWHTALAQALAYKKFKASRAPPDPYTPVTKERKDEQASKAYLAWKEECIVKARREVLSKAKKARVKTTKKSAKASGTLTNPNSEQLSEVSAVVGTIVTEVVGRMSVVPVAGGMSESEKFLQQVKNGGLSPVQPEFKDEEPASLASPALKDEFADVTDNATLDDSVVVESQKMLKSILLDEMIPVAKKETAAPSKVEKGFAWPEVLSDEKTLGDYSALSDDAQTVFDGVVSSNEIMVRVVTWNQQAKTPPSTALLRDALFAVGKFHLLVIGTEECENTIAGSIVNTSKKKWEEAVKIACGESYVKVRGHTLQATNNMVMVHVGVRQLVTEVGSGVVATGLSNPVAASQQLGNKGGVGIGLKIGDTSFCFVNAHLAAHQKEVERRNGEFEKIGRELGGMLGGEGTVLQTFDNVFFGGDMNYRINGTRQVVDKLLEKDMYDHLVKNDQLALAMFSNDCFDGFVEGPLHFKPTYKFDKNSDQYDTGKKQRIPSWTDRVLYKPGDGVTLINYGSVTSIKTSDHRPVYASFKCQVKGVAGKTWAEGGGGFEDEEGVTKSQVCAVM